MEKTTSHFSSTKNILTNKLSGNLELYSEENFKNSYKPSKLQLFFERSFHKFFGGPEKGRIYIFTRAYLHR